LANILAALTLLSAFPLLTLLTLLIWRVSLHFLSLLLLWLLVPILFSLLVFCFGLSTLSFCHNFLFLVAAVLS
jgi:hypothetical protein